MEVVFPLAVTSGPVVCFTFSGVCLSVDGFVCSLLEDYSADGLCPRVSGSHGSVSHRPQPPAATEFPAGFSGITYSSPL